MKMKFIVLFALSFLIIGCSTTYELRKMPSDEFVAKFNSISQNKTAQIDKITGTQFKAQNVRMTSDSLYWTGLKVNGSAENRRIYRAKFKYSGKGALEGLGVGILIGFSAGAVIGLTSGDDEPGFLSFTAEEKASILGVTFGALGGIFGLIAGATSGHKDVFILNKPQDYFPLANAVIVEETSDTVRLRWRDTTFDIRKLEAFIEKKNGITIIYVLKEELTRSLNKSAKRKSN